MHNSTFVIGGQSLGITEGRRLEILDAMRERLVQEKATVAEREIFMDIAARKDNDELVALNVQFWNARA